MSHFPKEKKILVIGDPYLCLIAVAAGTDYLEYKDTCKEIDEYLRKNISKYGAVIITHSVSENCPDILNLLKKQEDLLVVTVAPPRELEKIDPKKYYEKLVTEYIGLKISLK